MAEDIDAAFFDADGDKDVDLVVVSGGYVFPENSAQTFRPDCISMMAKGTFLSNQIPCLL